MNHKITFQELVDTIAEQSGKSGQFTHDFIKDLATLVKEALEKDGSANIAGLGKFELKKMDEREGYNPETEEKITIPAHNKIDFTPYKDLRELVNAPYSHMEPEIIDEEKQTASPEDKVESEGEGEGEEQQKTEEGQTETGSFGSDEESEKKKAPWEEDMESEIEVDEDDPFGLNKKQKSSFPYSFEIEDAGESEEERQDTEKREGEEDIIEFSPELSTEDRQEKEQKQPSDEPEEQAEEGAVMEEQKPEQQATTPASAGKSKMHPKKTGFRDRSHRRHDSGGAFWIIAAAFIILLLAIGAWYFMGAQQEVTPQTADSETRQVLDEEESENLGQAEEPQPAEQEDADQQQTEEEDGAKEESAAEAEQNTGGGQQADAQSGQVADPDASPPVETITVAAGQTLWGLADDEYQNPYLWPWIYDTNRSDIDDPDIIYTGQLLDIPQRRGQNDQLSNNDSLQVALGYVETYLWYKENNLDNARFYLYAAKKYHSRVFEYTDATFDEDDLRFANRAQ